MKTQKSHWEKCGEQERGQADGERLSGQGREYVALQAIGICSFPLGMLGRMEKPEIKDEYWINEDDPSLSRDCIKIIEGNSTMAASKRPWGLRQSKCASKSHWEQVTYE